MVVCVRRLGYLRDRFLEFEEIAERISNVDCWGFTGRTVGRPFPFDDDAGVLKSLLDVFDVLVQDEREVVEVLFN